MPFVYFSLDVPKRIINQAIGGQDIPETILGFPVTQVSFLLAMCGLFLALVIVNGLFKYIINVYRGVVGERILRRFRFDLYSRILRFPLPHFKRTSSSELIPMVTAETEPLGGFVGDSFALPAFQGGLLLTYLFFIFSQDFWLGLAAIALYPPQMWLIPKLQRKVNALAKQRVQSVRRFADNVGESVSGIEEIHANDTSRFERAKVSSILGRIFDIRYEIYRRKFFIKFLNNFLAQLTPFFFYAIGGYFVINDRLSLGALVAVIAAYKDLAPPWKELLKYYQTKEDIKVKYNQIIEQFQPQQMLKPSLLSSAEEQVPVPPSWADAQLLASNVQYAEDEYVRGLQGVSFRFNLHDHVGIVGRAGSGKEFIAPLISRLIAPTQGQIKVDGVATSDLSETVIGSRLAYVGPTAHVFTGSIEDNILYGLKNAPGEEEGDAKTDKRVRDALLTGTSTDDPEAQWIDFKAVDVQGYEDLITRATEISRVVDLQNDIFEFGLNGRVDPQDQADFSQSILRARLTMQGHLGEEEYSALVEPFNEDRYNVNMSVAENFLFGTALDEQWSMENLSANNVARDVLEQCGVTDELVKAGHRLTEIMLDLFSDVEPDSELFERFSFIRSEDLPSFAALVKRIKTQGIGELEDEDRDRLFTLPLTLTVARHRLGLIDESIQKKVVDARKQLVARLGPDNTGIKFFDADQYNPAMTVQDNILFGKVTYGQAHAQERVGELIKQTLVELQLNDDIERLGMAHHGGSSGARLTAVQRQKISIARALIKDPDLLVMDQATSVLDPAAEEAMVDRIRTFRDGKGVAWVVDRPELVQEFDHVLVFDRGRLVEQGGYSELAARGDGTLSSLLATA